MKSGYPNTDWRNIAASSGVCFGQASDMRRRGKYDYSLYLVTDRRCMSAATLCEAVEQAISGGCTMVQLREEETFSSDFYRLAREVKRVTDHYRVPLIINNRADIALAVGAAGVHVGQKDLPAYAVRKIIGKEMLLGVSAATLMRPCRPRGMERITWASGPYFPQGQKRCPTGAH